MASHQLLPQAPPRSPSSTPPSTSRLLTLPAEIRSMILTCLLAGSGNAKFQVDFGVHQRWVGKNEWKRADGWHIARSLDQHSAQMLRVSRQVYQEGTPILYGCNRFDLRRTAQGRHPTCDNPTPILKRAIGNRNLHLIRSVALHRTAILPPVVRALRGLQNVTFLGLLANDVPEHVPGDVWKMEHQEL